MANHTKSCLIVQSSPNTLSFEFTKRALVSFYYFVNEVEEAVNASEHLWLARRLARLVAVADDADELLLAFPVHHQRLARVALAGGGADASHAHVFVEVLGDVLVEEVAALLQRDDLEARPLRRRCRRSC